MEPSKVVRLAKRRGLDGIAITDHDTIEGALEARAHAGDGFLVIVGEEVTTRAGDIIGLFLTEKVDGPDPVAAIEAIHAQGGVALLPHPFSKTLGVDEQVARMLDACEGFNHRYSADDGTSEAAPFALEYDLTLTGSSDAHRYRDIGCGRTFVPAETPERIREALLKGNVTYAAHRPGAAMAAWYALADTVKWIVDPIPERLLYEHEGAH